MNELDFLSSLAEKVEGKLKSLGYEKNSKGLFVRFKNGHEINLIYIQKQSSRPMVSVNFGVHYDFLPKIGSTDLPKQGEIELPDCEIKVRLTPNTKQNDYWWPMDSSSLDEIASLIGSKSDEFFTQYDMDKDIGKISPNELENCIPALFPSVTKVRACLVLASIHESNGEKKLAAEFAKLGIKTAGMAVGPKKALKQVLKRVE